MEASTNPMLEPRAAQSLSLDAFFSASSASERTNQKHAAWRLSLGFWANRYQAGAEHGSNRVYFHLSDVFGGSK